MEIPQRVNLQLGTQVWKLVCSSHLREEFLRSCWIELTHICLSQNLRPVSNKILWKLSVKAVSMWALQAISSTKGVCMPWRQLSARREIDKADTWFSLRYSPAYSEILWKQNIQAVSLWEVQVIISTLRNVYALQADVC